MRSSFDAALSSATQLQHREFNAEFSARVLNYEHRRNGHYRQNDYSSRLPHHLRDPSRGGVVAGGGLKFGSLNRAIINRFLPASGLMQQNNAQSTPQQNNNEYLSIYRRWLSLLEHHRAISTTDYSKECPWHFTSNSCSISDRVCYKISRSLHHILQSLQQLYEDILHCIHSIHPHRDSLLRKIEIDL